MDIIPRGLPQQLRPTGKLVRDKIPAIMNADGVQAAVVRIDDDVLYDIALRHKLVEESQEAADENEASAQLQEMADVYEVLRARMELRGLTMDDLAHYADAKADGRGGFSDRLWVDNV